MKLIIDIGNRLVKVALFNNKELIKSTTFFECSLSNISKFVLEQKVSRMIISSVKKIDEKTLAVIKEYKGLVFDHQTKTPITVKYKTPETLGKDRLAGIVGASYLYGGKDVVVFDCGTCLTIDVVTAKKEYIGGRISPGLMMRYNALHKFTDKLPRCDFVNSYNHFIGDDTISSINSGVQQGIIEEITGTITNFRKENKDIVVILTGGDCFFFEKALKNTIFANPFLVMIGLNEILDYNE